MLYGLNKLTLCPLQTVQDFYHDTTADAISIFGFVDVSICANQLNF